MFDDIDLNLTILQEECAEVIQASTKSQRFGLFNYHPDLTENYSNHKLLSIEIGHLLAMIDIVVKNTGMQWQDIQRAKHDKREKLKKWYKIDLKSNIREED